MSESFGQSSQALLCSCADRANWAPYTALHLRFFEYTFILIYYISCNAALTSLLVGRARPAGLWHR